MPVRGEHIKSLNGIAETVRKVRPANLRFRGGMQALAPPERFAEIDLVLIGERAGSSADRAADQRTLDRSTDQRTTDEANAGADATTTDGTIRRTVAARA
jgi:hypothetical protein